MNELSVHQSAIVVVAEHYVGPSEAHHVYVAQVNYSVVITVDVVTVSVQEAERNVERCAECDAQDAVDYGSSMIGTPVCGYHRTVVVIGSGTMNACGRRQGA